MVLLDQDRVVQAEAVVLPATAGYRVLLCQAQAGQRLARVQDARARALHHLHEAPRLGRRGREGLQEVERRALAGEDGARRSFQAAEHGLGRDLRTLGDLPGHRHRIVQLTEHLGEPGLAADHRLLAAEHVRAGLRPGGDQVRGEIAGADVLVQRTHHHQVEIEGRGDHSFFTCGREK